VEVVEDGFSVHIVADPDCRVQDTGVVLEA